VSLAIVLVLAGGKLSGQIAVVTYHNNNGRTGVDSAETILTPENVNTGSFGMLFSYPIADGTMVYAQPLYLSNVSTSDGSVHNIVYVATMGDMMYAFDADGLSGSPLWQADLSNSNNGGMAIPCGDIGACHLGPLIGILSTPVIDTDGGTLYVVAQTEENGGIVQRLHALDVGNGAEKFAGPVTIRGSVSGTGAGSDGQNIVFNPAIQNQRSALLLAAGNVYIAWGSYGDASVYHGWVMAYDAGTLNQVAVWNDTPNGSAGGIWAPGDVMADAGNIFVTTGNGDSTAQNGGTEFSDAVVKLDPSLNILDFFMPPNVDQLNDLDLDLAGGGFIAAGGLLIGGGKDGTVYVINGNRLGGWDPSGGNVVHSLPSQIGGSGCLNEGCIYALPSLWNGNLYYIGQNDVLKVFSWTGGSLSGPTSLSGNTFSIRGAPPSISSNGGVNGIVWAVDVDNNNGDRLVLHAYDATNAANELWNSDQSGGGDFPGNGSFFIAPTVANGRVYVAATGLLSAYGLR
jgi:hypothetical protein